MGHEMSDMTGMLPVNDQRIRTAELDSSTKAFVDVSQNVSFY